MPIFPLVVWCSLVPPLPALFLSSLTDDRSLVAALAGASWLSIAAAIYLGTLTTIFGYAVWGRLLQRHSASVVAPFALLSPCTAIRLSWRRPAGSTSTSVQSTRKTCFKASSRWRMARPTRSTT